MINLERIGLQCTLCLRGKVNFLTATDFLPKPMMARGVTHYNEKPMQGLTSDTCGDYCLFYLFHRARNIDMNRVI